MEDASKKTKVQIRMETVIDENQIKQEVNNAQKVADANEVTIPMKTEQVAVKDIKQDVQSVQKTVEKTPVEIPVKLTKKEVQDELNKLIKQKGKSQEEVKAKLDEIMKGMDLTDVVKDSIKELFVKYRSMANSKKGFSSASTKSKDEFVGIADNFSKKTKNKKANAIVSALTNLTAGQAQVYRNENKSKKQLKQYQEDIYSDVAEARKQKEKGRERYTRCSTKKDKCNKVRRR